jgi:ADP-heptose:LPS heptosyltransferase
MARLTAWPPHCDLRRSMNLLLFKVSELGDNVVFVPVVQQLRRLFPEAKITLFTEPKAAPLFHGPLGATRLVAAERSVFNASWRKPFSFLHFWLKASTTNARACLLGGDQGNVAHILAQLTAGPIRVGASEPRLRVPAGLTHRVHRPATAKLATWNWEMGRALAAALGRYDWPLRPVPPDFTHLIAPRSTPRPSIVLHAGSRFSYGNWPLENFAELARRLGDTYDVIWIDEPRSRGTTTTPFEEKLVPSDTLAELVSRLAQARLFVGHHSEALQLAAALGCPGVVLSGPTHSEWDPVWHSERFEILRAPGLKCLPCHGPANTPGRCGNDAAPDACMQHWSVDDVERRCREWIVRWSRPAQGTAKPF